MEVLPLYFKKHTIKLYELDATGKLSATALAHHIQENAAEHARRMKIGFNELQKNNHIWLLSRLHLKIFDFPIIDSEIETETWVKDYDKLFSYRDFHFKIDEKIFAAANTAWLIVDSVKKQIVPVENYVSKSFKLTNRCILQEPIKKLKGVGELAEYVFEHKVRYSSLDINFHVNNVSYLFWYIDYLPNDIALNPITELTVNYLHELKLNQKVNIYYIIKEYDNNWEVTCEITDAASNKAACKIYTIHNK